LSIKREFVVPYEILWVDNNSSPDNVASVKKQIDPKGVNYRLIRNSSNLGFVKATNMGVREARGKYILFLNNDTEVGVHLDQTLLSPLVSDPKIGAVGPVSDSDLGWQGINGINARFNVNLPKFAGGVHNYSTQLFETWNTKYIPLGKTPLYFFCTMFKKETFERVGYLNEELGIGLGDDDIWNLQAHAMGYSMLLSLGSFVWHKHRATFKSMGINISKLRNKNTPIIQRVANSLAAK
jgi:GT2 family glycosyltransferase